MSPLPCEYGDALLQVQNVSVTLGGTPLLRDVNLTIRDLVRPGLTQGQVVGLLGPSGVGKTTLFRILAGLDEPDSGQVLVDKECRPVQRGTVGVVAQTYPLLEHRTIRGNLMVAGRQAGLPKRASQQKADTLLRRFGLDMHGAKYPVQLSGGQRQRVAIAQQFMCSDHFLLMDEPFSGLDIVASERVSQLIQEMAQADELKTFVLVTHDIAAALQVCDTIVLLGRDQDAQGAVVPGARIQATYDLVERGIAWRAGASALPEFLQLLGEIRTAFAGL